MHAEQLARMRTGKGFIAALDQSGGSTPKALKLYGIEEGEYSGEAQMFDLIHAMRSRMIRSRAFDGRRVLGAILFEGTMDREIDGVPTAEYLWARKGVVPFLKVDKGLAEQRDGVQVMKPMPELDALLARARAKGIFGTKMRSVIALADEAGVRAVVAQQFEVGRRILAAGLVPIISHPERNPYLRRQVDDLTRWVSEGCYLQVTAGSLVGTFGADARRASEDLIARGLVHIVASDAHDIRRRTPTLREAYGTLADTWGEDAVRPMFVENPGAVVRSEPIVHEPVRQRTKAWYRFWA